MVLQKASHYWLEQVQWWHRLFGRVNLLRPYESHPDHWAPKRLYLESLHPVLHSMYWFQSCKPTASFYHKCINMAMITALKFDDFAFTGISSGQSDGEHDCFCTGTNKPHFFKKAVILYDELTHLCAITCGCTKTCTLFYRFHYGFWISTSLWPWIKGPMRHKKISKKKHCHLHP